MKSNFDDAITGELLAAPGDVITSRYVTCHFPKYEGGGPEYGTNQFILAKNYRKGDVELFVVCPNCVTDLRLTRNSIERISFMNDQPWGEFGP